MNIRTWFFKWRGALMIPLAIIVLYVGAPVLVSYMAGLAVALIGEAMRIWGVGYAGKTTRAQEIKAPFLVTAGPYAYVRNPLYLGNALTGLGFVIMACGALPWAMRALLICLYLLFYGIVYGTIIPQEEAYLSETFGETYDEYCKNVPRIIPRITPYSQKQGTFSWSPIWIGEIQTLIMFIIFSVIMTLKMLFLSSPA
jgi:protein-S-isoprenylcysteine O-methyltransferase Ste14